MRQLHLLRHAKSSWDDPSLPDFDRGLNKRGVSAARAMARYLRSIAFAPQHILCSAAQRTRQTYDIIAPSLPGVPVEFLHSLYETSALTLLENIRQQADDTKTLLVVGHNPGLEELARSLSGMKGEPLAIQHLGEKFPTGSLLSLTITADHWRDVEWNCAQVTGFVRPRDLAA